MRGNAVTISSVCEDLTFWLFICYYSYLQANTYEELPEQVIGAARLAHVEPSTAVVPNLENNSESNKDNSSNDATSSEDDSSKKTNWFSIFFWGIRWDFSIFFIFQALLLVLNQCTNLQSGWSLRAPILSSEFQTCSFISFSITVHSCSSLQFVNAIPYVQAGSVIYLHTIREHIRLSNN